MSPFRRSGLTYSGRPGGPTAEAAVSNSVRCGFKSHPGHDKLLVTYADIFVCIRHHFCLFVSFIRLVYSFRLFGEIALGRIAAWVGG